MWSAVVGVIAQLGMWWLGKVGADNEKKKNFLKFISGMNKTSLNSAKLNSDWAEIMKEMEK